MHDKQHSWDYTIHALIAGPNIFFMIFFHAYYKSLCRLYTPCLKSACSFNFLIWTCKPSLLIISSPFISFSLCDELKSSKNYMLQSPPTILRTYLREMVTSPFARARGPTKPYKWLRVTELSGRSSFRCFSTVAFLTTPFACSPAVVLLATTYFWRTVSL